LPLLIALIKLRKSLAPVAVAIGFSVALPWCVRLVTQHYDYGKYHNSYTYTVPNLLAHALVAAFCVFIIWWGVRQASRALVNLGIVGFAIAVGWFYFSDIFDKVGRALGLIGLGILFLAGGWALEKMRRGLIGRMGNAVAVEEAE
jgi:peptidoglycan/LPS O-acetylase OafA/YrhL